MVFAYLYDLLLIATVIAASVWGGMTERWGAAIMTAATGLSILASIHTPALYAGVDLLLAATDGVTYLALLALAYRSKRFWPVWAAGLQLLTFGACLAPLWDRVEVPFAYALTEQFWAWPILLMILAVSIYGDRIHEWIAFRR